MNYQNNCRKIYRPSIIFLLYFVITRLPAHVKTATAVYAMDMINKTSLTPLEFNITCKEEPVPRTPAIIRVVKYQGRK